MNINKAKVLAYSKNEAGRTLITFETETDCVTHTQMSQHRSATNSAKSKRSQKAIVQMREIEEGYAYSPQVWHVDQKKGMQPTEEFSLADQQYLSEKWKRWQDHSLELAEYLQVKGVARQLIGKVLMPFKVIKAMWTFPDYGFENFLELRAKEGTDAQYEINDLAIKMRDARDNLDPVLLKNGEYHIPYSTPDKSLQENIYKSVACTAFMSYDSQDKERTPEKYKAMYDRLLRDKHMSCFQHIAICRGDSEFYESFCGFASLREVLKERHKVTGRLSREIGEAKHVSRRWNN